LRVLQLLPDACVDAVITDPPYGVAYQHHCCRSPAGGWISKWGEIAGDRRRDWADDVWRELARVLKPDSYAVPFFGWPRADELWAIWRRHRLRLLSRVVWVKERWMGLGHHTRGQHEQCMVLGKGRPRPQSRSFRDVRIHGVEHGLHATQKPVGLMRDLVGQFSAPGDVVLDPFMGSGSTGLAAAELGRRFIGIELDRTYFATARKRFRLLERRAAAA
jgi:DNA modification methylase